MITQLDSAIQMLGRIVAFDTTPLKPTSSLIELIEEIFKINGVEYKKQMTSDGRHGVLLGRLGPDAPGGCVLSGHLDVVSVDGQDWNTDPFQLHNDGANLYARGACDMKGFIACALSLLPRWKEQKLETPIYLGFTADEETEVKTINDLINLIDPVNRPNIAILGEPTSMDIISAHKGCHEFSVKIRGKASHASQPDGGVNAIYVAQDVIGYVRELEEKLRRSELDTSFSPPHATVNIGTIKGGNAVNTVAEQCEMIWDIRRVLNSQGGNIKEDFSLFVAEKIAPKYPGAQVDISDFLFLSALEARPSSMAVEIARCCSSGHRHVTTASFGTEAGFFQSAGIDAVVCGPGSIKQAHKANEFVPINEIQECVDMLSSLARPDVVGRLAKFAGQTPART